MNLTEAIAYVDAMAPTDKAAWDKANRFTTDVEREKRAVRMYLAIDSVELPEAGRMTPDDLIDLIDEAQNLALNLTEILTLLRIWPGDPDRNHPTWLDPA